MLELDVGLLSPAECWHWNAQVIRICTINYDIIAVETHNGSTSDRKRIVYIIFCTGWS